MLISREMDYALRIIRALSSGPHSAQEIADMETMTRAITLKVLNKLKKAGIITSIRGQVGGYQLKEHWQNLTLCDLIAAMEGDLLVNRCQCPGYTCENCPEGCAFRNELSRIQNVLYTELTRRTLQEILQAYPSQKGESS